MPRQSVFPNRPAARAPSLAQFGAAAPGGFAAVMATGIVSIAAHLLAYDTVGWLLLAANAVLYPAMWTAMFVRGALFPLGIVEAFASHETGPGFLTMVAANRSSRQPAWLISGSCWDCCPGCSGSLACSGPYSFTVS